MAVGATMIPDPLARLDVHASRMRKPLLRKWTTIGLFCAGPHGHSLSLAPANSLRTEAQVFRDWGQKPKWPEVAPMVGTDEGSAGIPSLDCSKRKNVGGVVISVLCRGHD